MKRTIRDLKNVKGQRVLVRCDFNVLLDHWGDILDDNRIVEAVPTIKFLSEAGAKVILCSHLGRPKGYDKFLSLFPVAVRLMKYFPNKVKFCSKTIGQQVEDTISKMKNGDIILLENLRFDHREEENAPTFVKDLCRLADIYVDDAFGTSHRKHASNFGVALKKPSALGFLIEKELQVFENAFKNPQHPFVTIFGGAKVSDKLNMIKNVMNFADTIIIGGGMAYTFLQAQGFNVGDSIVEAELVVDAQEILNLAKSKNIKILLPVDHIVEFKGKAKKTNEIKSGMKALDIGAKTIKMFSAEIANAKQILWNGPMGKYEEMRFSKGTMKIAKAVANSEAFSIVGGGDSVSAVRLGGFEGQINHLSTGGGASLKLMEGKTLPAIEVIDTL